MRPVTVGRAVSIVTGAVHEVILNYWVGLEAEGAAFIHADNYFRAINITTKWSNSSKGFEPRGLFTLLLLMFDRRVPPQ